VHFLNIGKRLTGGLAAVFLLGACASSEAARAANDPFEPMNRAVFAFNQAADDAVLRPVAEGYMAVTPKPVQTGVHNVLVNLNQPVVFVHTVLQGRPNAAADTLARLIMNTIFGIGGIFDLATHEGLPLHQEDFGQTLAVWGVSEGPYLVLPIWGPSSLRDAPALYPDLFLHPVNWDGSVSSSTPAWAFRGVTVIDVRVQSDGVLGRLDRAAIDPYIQMRSAWRQFRAEQIRNSQARRNAYDDLPDFDDFD